METGIGDRLGDGDELEERYLEDLLTGTTRRKEHSDFQRS